MVGVTTGVGGKARSDTPRFLLGPESWGRQCRSVAGNGGGKGSPALPVREGLWDWGLALTRVVAHGMWRHVEEASGEPPSQTPAMAAPRTRQLTAHLPVTPAAHPSQGVSTLSCPL